MKTIIEIVPNLTNMLNVSYNDNILINSNVVENYLLKKYGCYYTLNNTPEEFKIDFDIYNSLMADGLNKIINAFNTEYNPVENYNSNIEEHNIYGQRVSTFNKGEQSNHNNYGDRDNTTTDSVTSYDSADFKDTSRTINNNKAYADILTEGNRIDKDIHDTYTDAHTLNQHGNIGVTTSQHMINEEVNLRLTNIYYKYLDEFAKNWLFYIE